MKSSRKPASSKRRSQLAVARALLFFFVFLGLEILFENKDQFQEGSSCEAAHADETPWLYDYVYPHLTSLLLRKSSDEVAVVYVPEDLSEVQQNVCRGRAYLTALIDLVQAQRPAAIVLDKFFSNSTCMNDEKESNDTASLQTAVSQAVAAGVPVVAGEATDAANVEAGESCLVRKADFDFFHATPNFPYGLTKLNANREQIPLAWRVLAGQPSPSTPRLDPQAVPLLESLALTTAKIVEKDPGASSRLQSLTGLPRQPYTRLLPLQHSVRSDQLLCCRVDHGGRDATPSSRVYTTYRAHGALPFPVRGKVVLIGSQSVADQRLVLGKKRWGYELQAAYIEALLSGSYLKAVPGPWIFGLSVFFLLILEAVPASAEFLHCERHVHVPSGVRKPELWLWIWSPLFIAVLFACCAVGGYLPPLSVIMGVVLTWLARALFNGMEYFQKQSVPDRKESES